MSDFATIADELNATPKASGFGAIAQDFAPPKAAPVKASGPPSFQTNDPAEMRRQLAAKSDPSVLAVFDRQFPGYAPKSVAPAVAVARPSGEIPGAVSPSTEAPETWWDKIKGIGEAALTTATGAAGALVGGPIGAVNELGKGALTALTGGDMSQTVGPEAGYLAGAKSMTYEPRTQAGQRYAENVGKAINASGLVAIAPLAEAGLLSQAAGPATRAVGDQVRSSMDAAFAAKKVPPPRIEPTMAAEKPLYRRVAGEWQEVPKAEASAPTATKGAITFDSPPVEGGVPKTVVPDRAAVLKRIGLEDVRTSAVTGDIAKAGQDFQVSKYTSEPAGLAAKAQFDAERQALVNHGEKTVAKTGGALGLDQDTVNVRGQTIAKPFDSLRTWFGNAKAELYAEAEKRSQGLPAVQPTEVETLLNDRSFNNSAMAQDKGNLVSAIKNQLELFKENNPVGLTVKNTEEFNQWLNQNWSPDNARIIGRVRNAMDEAVTKSAGEDVFAKARAIHALEKKTLDNPSGVAKLMDFDPKTPINRVTPYDKVPDKLTGLPPAQFENIVKTLEQMPKELQPEAQAAIAEIQSHYANKLLKAGADNKGQWNAKRVTDFRKSNGANINLAFKTNEEALAMLNDLQSAGHILDFPSSYPGASAQAAGALKRGLMSGLTQKAGAFIGGGAGSVFGPAGGAGGAVVGEAVGKKLGASMAEKSALKQWQSGVTKLSEISK